MNTDYEIQKIKHLNLVLRAFRDVGRLLVTENDKQKLINGICNILVETRGYYNAWIGLIDKHRNVKRVAQAGFSSQFDEMRTHLKQKTFTRCIEQTFASEDVFSVADPVKECPDCLLSKKYSGRGSMAARLTHEDKNYGFLVLSVPQELSLDDTEKNIVKEIADDIAFGLYRMDLEVKRKKAVKELEESQLRFETLIKNSLNCIAIFQNDQKIYGNAGLRKIHHQIIDAFEPPNFKNIYIEDLPGIKNIYNDLVSDRIRHIDTDFRYYPQGKEKEDSQLRWASVRARKIEYLGKESIITNLMDITDSKEVETFLRIQDKMTSLGRVTAGIAHEIRNPLSGIYIYLKSLKKIYKNMGDVNSVLSIIDKVTLAADKIESIIKRVMDFSRPASPHLIKTNINKNIDDVTKLTSVSLRKNGIKFIKELSPDIPDCWNEPLLIEQVVLNLITNAAEAMKDFDGEKIIRLKTCAKKDTVVICVEDSGPGIPLSSHSKIFDPFYTTKTNSSGIGLSICHRIITDHGGSLRFNPDVPKGARFVIELPINKNGKIS
ncbi:MAG: GHKL domain-containing protein [Proteobacteria bacterium]|nr:GHKL domain-containing protein [Pseudomonadota bacterium]MBU1386548.1 GHKL domain-containing protein [Pseudomonadota bacterium]MBU1544659.1 GHKL domain-containing protein [Pseudomonadota bacterium]MBU2429147.1 GHKL domain-containing protein [Pseudomonadota bacterium]MBU2481362.1 GHKL domain-containing protein [Pseudomonadota bacterium]